MTEPGQEMPDGTGLPLRLLCVARYGERRGPTDRARKKLPPRNVRCHQLFLSNCLNLRII